MINIIFLVVFAVIGIGLGVLYNFLVIKKYPDNKRKFGYVITVFVFFLCAAALYAIFSVRSGVNSIITDKSNGLEQTIREKNPNNSFVRNGIDLKAISSDASRLNSSAVELKNLLLSYTGFSFDKFPYNLVGDYVTKVLTKGMSSMNDSGKLAGSFADENNFMTLSSTINGVQKSVLKIVNIVFLVVAAIFVLILLIHIIRSLAIAAREKKAGKS